MNFSWILIELAKNWDNILNKNILKQFIIYRRNKIFKALLALWRGCKTASNTLKILFLWCMASSLRIFFFQNMFQYFTNKNWISIKIQFLIFSLFNFSELKKIQVIWFCSFYMIFIGANKTKEFFQVTEF